MEGLEGRTLLTTTPGSLLWGLPLGATQQAVTTDEFGESYVVGRFSGTVDFNSSSRRTTALTAINAGGDMFVARFRSDGSLAWVKQIGSASGQASGAGIVAIPFVTRGGVWIAGSFTGSVDFNPGAAAVNVTSQGGSDAFLLGLWDDGSFRTVNRLGAANDETPVGISRDGRGYLYVAGAVTGGADTQGFAAKYTGKGKFFSKQTWAATGVDVVPTAVTADDAGDFYLAGTISGAYDFSPHTSRGLQNGPTTFLLKQSSGGKFAWVGSIPGATINDLASDAVDVGVVAVVGSFSNTIDLNFSPRKHHNLVSNGGSDAFVARFAANGSLFWANGMGGTGNDTANTVAVDATRRIYVGGEFRNTATFWTGHTLVSAGGADAFVARYCPICNSIFYVDRFGGAGDDAVDHVAVTNETEAIAIGPLRAAGDYDPVFGTRTFAPLPGHSEDLFLIHLG